MLADIKALFGCHEVAREDGYVPSIMCPNKNGYGDYIKMTIDENGSIANWQKDISDFIDKD